MVIKGRKKILFIAPLYPNRSPSQRYRFEQYIPFFEENGYDCEFSWLLDEKDDKIFYSRGYVFDKALMQIDFVWKRIKDVIRARKFDIIFIQREAFFLGTTVFEYLLSKSGAKVIFDFDDSIWLPNVSDGNVKFTWLKDYGKTAKLVKLADLVIAGNNYLAGYALNFNKNTIIIPTTIDTENHYFLRKRPDKNLICIGWTGSMTTIRHFKLAEGILFKLKEKYQDKLYFKVIGDQNYYNEKLEIKGVKWSPEREVGELNEIDIGIMPLPDDEWSKGKCGFKGLQYMALGIPAIMSPVGVNTEIINDGVNGFLADSDEEWIEKLSILIENSDLRKKIGSEGRKTVIERYSVESQKYVYLNAFNQLLEK